jgi:hypothetical protein
VGVLAIGVCGEGRAGIDCRFDQAGIVGTTLYEPDLLGVADRLLKVRTRKPYLWPTYCARRQDCGLLALRRWSWAMNAAARWVFCNDQPMMPQCNTACQQCSVIISSHDIRRATRGHRPDVGPRCPSCLMAIAYGCGWARC